MNAVEIEEAVSRLAEALFSSGVEVPRFSKIARSYLLHVGNLDWKQINPDIFWVDDSGGGR